MKDGKVWAIGGIALAVAVGLFLILKPKKSDAQPTPPPFPPNPNPVDEDCPPTFVKCPNSNKCYNPLLVDKKTGLNPNGTNPCAEVIDFGYDYTTDFGYDYETGVPNFMPDK